LQGCDASILLDASRSNPNPEKNAILLRGYEAVNKIKTALETICPGVVSCADVLAFAARDSTSASGSFTFAMPSGRRDGLVSVFGEVFQHMPSPSFQVEELLKSFADKGLDALDLVALSGAHSFGRTTCNFVKPRLYPTDPTMNATFAAALRSVCPQSGGGSIPVNNNLVSLDPNRLSNQFFSNVAAGKVLFTSDQTLSSSSVTAAMVADNAARPIAWMARFAGAMKKMGGIEVLTGYAGEVRKVCFATNKAS
jgi:peroxidase